MDELIIERVKRNEARIDSVEKKLEDIKDELHRQDMADIERLHSLKELITTAVQEGNKGTKMAVEEIKTQLHERILTLETEKERVALEEKEEREAAKKETKKHAVRTVIAAIIGFFMALMLNNIIPIILAQIEN